MKSLLVIALALVLGAGLIWIADFEPGFVLLQYGGWSLETSLIVFSVGFLILLVASYIALRSTVLLTQAPQKLAAWNESQRHKRAGRALTRGLITLEEGRWAEAERLLLRHASNSDTPLLHYLAAARAAQKQEEPERRDNYLRLAHETTDGADVAVGVVQAELQLESGQKEQALATLQHLREVSPKHPYVLQLLQQLYSDMNQWQSVQEVLPDLRKRRVLPASDVKALSSDASAAQLHAAIAKQDWTLMASVWQKLPNKIRQTEILLRPYISGLIQQGEEREAVTLIEGFLHKQWSDPLAYQYGVILHGDDLLKRLATAEKWLKDRSNNPWLLLTLGRLAKANKLWAKSEDYLRSSLECGPRGETYQVLAEVLASDGKDELIADIYKQGLAVMLEQEKLPV
ncbi:MAG: heme biosynthesis protein HemY [Methylophaga sp.]|nr:heme biosynthesis protein HemY [Methylophaga sp.]